MTTSIPARATTREIRQANRFAVLRSIYALSSPTRHEIAHRTGLSFPTVATVVNELLQTGLLIEAGKETSAGGRPRVRLKINADFGTLVGVDVAETYVHVHVYDAALQPVARSRRNIEGASEPAEVVRQIAEAVEESLDAPGGGSPRPPVLGVGVSMPGQVQAETGVSVFAPNWGWHDVPVAQLLRAHLPHRLYLDNPLKATTLGELWFGHGRRTPDLVTAYLGTGVGAGIAIGGELVRGTSNNAGEWGHTSLIMNGRDCRCGRRGCVEAYLGAPGLMQSFAEACGPGHRYLRSGSQTQFIREVRAGLVAGDADAIEMIDQFAEVLGYALANLVNTINPALVVLGSWVVDELGRWLIPPTEVIMREQSISSSATGLRLVVSGLSEPVALGMATLALEQHLSATSLESMSPTATTDLRTISR